MTRHLPAERLLIALSKGAGTGQARATGRVQEIPNAQKASDGRKEANPEVRARRMMVGISSGAQGVSEGEDNSHPSHRVAEVAGGSRRFEEAEAEVVDHAMSPS